MPPSSRAIFLPFVYPVTPLAVTFTHLEPVVRTVSLVPLVTLVRAEELLLFPARITSLLALTVPLTALASGSVAVPDIQNA